MTNPTNLPDHHYFRGFPRTSEPTPPRAQLVAGLGAALTVMLLAEAVLALVLVQLYLFLLLVLVTVALTLAVGTPLAVVLDRLTSRLAHARASLVFALVAFVLFGALGAWGGHALVTWLGQQPGYVEAGVGVSSGIAAVFGAFYLGTTFAMGAVAGRFVGPALSLRRGFVVAAWLGVAVVTALAVYFWFFTRLAPTA